MRGRFPGSTVRTRRPPGPYLLTLLLVGCNAHVPRRVPAAEDPPAVGTERSREPRASSYRASAAVDESPPEPNTPPSLMTTEELRLVLDFSDPTAARRFGAVDDRVMGGVSRSRLRHQGDWTAFEGELSTERNGGFASVRSERWPVDLSAHEGVALHVRGDGRTYKLRLRTDERFDGVSYQASFPTTDGSWTTVHLPFDSFRPTYRGRVLTNATPLDPSAVQSFGLLVADEQVGAFRLELRWIGAYGQR